MSKTDYSWAGLARQAPGRVAATLGIAVQLASAGTAYGQQALPTGAVPGVPTTPYTRPSDSTTGVTQATSHRDWLQTCAAGTVLSGTSCVPLPTTPSCAYGQVYTGGSCVPIGSFSPPPTNCPTGFVLSGESCVPLPTGAPAPAPSCGTQPITTQVIPCPSGQTGQVTQNRTASCTAGTGWSWQMGAWSTTSSTCAPAPSPGWSSPPPPSGCTTQNVSWGAWLGLGSACTGVVYAVGHGQTSGVSNQAGGFAGSQSYVCLNGSWSLQSQDCRSVQPPPPPPPQCSAASGQATWGSTCTGYVNAPATSVGGTYSINGADGNGRMSWVCATGGNWVETERTCPPRRPLPPSPPSGCAAQWISYSASTSGEGVYTPSAVNGQIFPHSGNNCSGTFQCLNGSWMMIQGGCDNSGG